MPAPLRDKKRDQYVLPDGGTARSLIYTSGAWLTELFPQLLTPRLLSAVRHQIFHFGPGQGDTQFRPPAMPALVDRAYGFNLLPDIDGVGVRGWKSATAAKIGSAACTEGGWTYGSITVVAVSLKKKDNEL